MQSKGPTPLKAMTAHDLLHDRKVAYSQTFNLEGEAAKAVLADLARFCRADKSTFHPDARIHAVYEGRREVYLRIQDHLNKSVAELAEAYGARKEEP
jgi:hypothetical protein